jgi:hypothetical protein
MPLADDELVNNPSWTATRPGYGAPGHNHFSYIWGLGVDDDSVLDDAVCRFLADIMHT